MDNPATRGYGEPVLLGLIVPLLLTPEADHGPEDRLADLGDWARENGYLELESCLVARQHEAAASMAFYEAWLAELPDLRGTQRAEVEIRMELAVLDAREREVEAWDVCLGGMGERVLWAAEDAGRDARAQAPECVDLGLVQELERAAEEALAGMHASWGSELARVEYSRLVMASNRLTGVAEQARLCSDPDYAGSTAVRQDGPAYGPEDTQPMERR